jgi:hypothetical protein
VVRVEVATFHTSALEILLRAEIRPDNEVSLLPSDEEADCICVLSEEDALLIAVVFAAICPERELEADATLVLTPST